MWLSVGMIRSDSSAAEEAGEGAGGWPGRRTAPGAERRSGAERRRRGAATPVGRMQNLVGPGGPGQLDSVQLFAPEVAHSMQTF